MTPEIAATSGWEIAGSIANLVTALAAAAAVFAAWRGLRTWRHEMVGRRRMELAEQVIADFYEAHDVFRWVRSPAAYISEGEGRVVHYSSEGEGRAGREDEPEDVRRTRDMLYVPLKRLDDHAEFFSKLQARRYRVIATFGPDAAKPYEDLKAIRDEIIVAARMLMHMAGKRAREDKYENIVWSGSGDPDQIEARIDELIEEIEKRFRGEITKAVNP